MNNPEYHMMLETFMETAKMQNQKLVDGAVFIFVPRMSKDDRGASILTWMPDNDDSDEGSVWHDVFVSLLWALLNAGVKDGVLKNMIDYASKNLDKTKSTDLMETFEGGEVN